MKQQEITLRAFFYKYEKDSIIFHFLDEKTEPFTKSFLKNYYPGKNSHITINSFKSRIQSYSKAYTNKNMITQIPIMDLENKIVELKAKIVHTTYKKNYIVKSCWHLQILNIYPIQ